MKTGAIIRGCILQEDAKKESELIEERVKSKVDEISTKATEDFNIILGVFAEEMNKKINALDKYKEDLQIEYAQKCEENNSIKMNKIQEMEGKYLNLIKKQEEQMDSFISNAQDSIKELMIVLFEKFFYRQYNDVDNLKSIIQEGLTQLEESKNIQISINKQFLSEIKEKELEEMMLESNSKLYFKNLSKDNLIIEFKSEQNSIEVDFDKQMSKIKEVIMNF